MYPWCTHTINFIKGWCKHACRYCYIIAMAKRYKRKQRKPYLDEKEFRTNLGEGKTIFVGSSIDMFAKGIPNKWIKKVLAYCNSFPNNTYLFQTKNPKRYEEFAFPENTILGVTIESNKDYGVSKAPTPRNRYSWMLRLKDWPMEKMLSLEPLLDFDLDIFVAWIKMIGPSFVSIGADSKNSKLPEPDPKKVKALIKELKKFTKVKTKDNLRRLLK